MSTSTIDRQRRKESVRRIQKTIIGFALRTRRAGWTANDLRHEIEEIEEDDYRDCGAAFRSLAGAGVLVFAGYGPRSGRCPQGGHPLKLWTVNRAKARAFLAKLSGDE